ncbi:hypothetical protein [Kordia sp.]|uniref:hypothetical protein n=1 Tax=Kordia sp. TaxID=1965332 RepID=UPI003D26C65C
MAEEKGLKKALNDLNEAVKDLSSLHVQTFSGEVGITIDSDKGYKSIKEQIEKSKADGKLDLVAETLAQFDGDSYNFVKKDLDDIPTITLEVHKNAVKAGIETRIGLLGLFKSLLVK